jgi:CO/xanthine dehydrogenase FAD-binding subunit
MIPLLDQYELVTPASLRDALDDLAQHPGARPFAGGTDLMVVLEAGHLPPGRYVSLQNCRELVGIEETAHDPGRSSLGEGGVSIGALTTYTEIRNSAALAQRYPMLPMAAAETGGLATQNRGTIGGNIANASPAADTPPALLVYDAELELMSSAGTRRVPYAAFHQGYKKMDLAVGEIVARIHLPGRGVLFLDPVASAFRRNTQTRSDYFRKVGTRRAQAISKVCFAGSILMDPSTTLRAGGVTVKDVRIALGSVAPTVVRATRTEDSLRGKKLDEATIAAAETSLAAEIAPIDDIRSTARYRARVAANLLREFLGLKN